MSSADSAFRRLGPRRPPLGGRSCSPGGTCRATCPRPGRPAAAADSAASLGGGRAVAEPSLSALFASPLRRSPHPACAMESCVRDPFVLTSSHLPSLDLSLGRGVGTLVAPVAAVPSRAKLIHGPKLGTHPSTVSGLGSGFGKRLALRESAPGLSVWSLALSLTRVCLSSARRCVSDPRARQGKSLRPQPVLGAPRAGAPHSPAMQRRPRWSSERR